MGDCNSCFDVSRGRQGDAGVSSYTYYAYASTALGAGFSLVPSNSLKYISQVTKDQPATTLVLADFPLPFLKYIGDDGSPGINGTNGVNGTTVIYSDVQVRTCAPNASDESLESVVLAANALPNDGDFIEITAIVKGTPLSPPNPLQFNILFAGNKIWQLGGDGQSVIPALGTVYRVRVRIIRQSATGFNWEWEAVPLGGTNAVILAGLGAVTSGVDFTTPQTILFNVYKNSLAQVAGDFNLANFIITKYLQ